MTAGPDKTVPLYLATSGRQVLTGALGRLAHLFELDVYGSAFLSNRARIEMGYAALLLLLIFLFDTLAWSLLFNSIFYSGLLTVGWGTPFALAIALIFSLATFIYERQFITADASEGLLRFCFAITIRVGVLIMAALLTAQPIELFVFQGPIKNRIHEEGILKEVVHRRKQLEVAKKKAQGRTDEALKQKLERSDVHAAHQAAIGLTKTLTTGVETADSEVEGLATLLDQKLAGETKRAGEIKDLSSAIQRLEKQVESDRERLRRLQADLSDAEIEERRRYFQLEVAEQGAGSGGSLSSISSATVEEARLQLVSATDAVERLEAEIEGIDSLERLKDQRARLKSLRSKRNVNDGDLAALRLQKQRADEALATARADLEQQKKAELEAQEAFKKKKSEIAEKWEEEKQLGIISVDRLRDWVRELHQKGSQKKITESPTVSLPANTKLWVYERQDYDFFRQLRVLEDLKSGEPPRWPDVAPEARDQLTQEYSLEAASQLGDEARRRRAAETVQFRRTYYVVYFVAMVIPLLILAFKLLMAAELKSYYNSSDQAELGHPDALAFRFARRGRRSR